MEVIIPLILICLVSLLGVILSKSSFFKNFLKTIDDKMEENKKLKEVEKAAFQEEKFKYALLYGKAKAKAEFDSKVKKLRQKSSKGGDFGSWAKSIDFGALDGSTKGTKKEDNFSFLVSGGEKQRSRGKKKEKEFYDGLI